MRLPLSADILLLNMFDVQHPVINALPKVPEEETVRELKRLTGPRRRHQSGALRPASRKKQRWYAVENEQRPLATVENAAGPPIWALI